MDFDKHIEDLLQRYWLGETSLEEEAQLRAFFADGEVPERLRRSNRSYAFFGAWLRLCMAFMYLLREEVVRFNYPVIKINRRMYEYEKTNRIALGSHAADAFRLRQHKQLRTD